MPVKALEIRPELKQEYVWLYNAYSFLSPSRTLGAVGEYYIPLSEYEAYFSIFKIEEVSVREFALTVLYQVDHAMLSLRYAEKTTG